MTNDLRSSTGTKNRFSLLLFSWALFSHLTSSCFHFYLKSVCLISSYLPLSFTSLLQLYTQWLQERDDPPSPKSLHKGQQKRLTSLKPNTERWRRELMETKGMAQLANYICLKTDSKKRLISVL